MTEGYDAMLNRCKRDAYKALADAQRKDMRAQAKRTGLVEGKQGDFTESHSGTHNLTGVLK